MEFPCIFNKGKHFDIDTKQWIVDCGAEERCSCPCYDELKGLGKIIEV